MIEVRPLHGLPHPLHKIGDFALRLVPVLAGDVSRIENLFPIDQIAQSIGRGRKGPAVGLKVLRTTRVACVGLLLRARDPGTCNGNRDQAIIGIVKEVQTRTAAFLGVQPAGISAGIIADRIPFGPRRIGVQNQVQVFQEFFLILVGLEQSREIAILGIGRGINQPFRRGNPQTQLRVILSWLDDLSRAQMNRLALLNERVQCAIARPI